MEVTVQLDEERVKRAKEYTGIADENALMQEALTALIEKEAARWLARAGGSEPDLKPIPRRRPPLA